MPRIVSYTVGAIFEVGVYDYDKAYVIMPIEDAQTLLLMGDSAGLIEVQTNDPDRVGEILAPLIPKLGGQAVVTDWRSMNAQLFDALAVERVLAFVVVGIIMLVASFNIASALIMLVRAKARDIAIMRTMGAGRGAMLRIFVTVGTSIGVLGTLAGLLLGFVFLFLRQDVIALVQRLSGRNLWDPSIRILAELPSRPDPVEITAIAVTAMLLSFLATLYPAWESGKHRPGAGAAV